MVFLYVHHFPTVFLGFFHWTTIFLWFSYGFPWRPTAGGRPGGEEPPAPRGAAARGRDLPGDRGLRTGARGLEVTWNGGWKLGELDRIYGCLWWFIVVLWRFGTFFIVPYIGNECTNWLIFFRGFETTNQFIVVLEWFYSDLHSGLLMQTGWTIGFAVWFIDVDGIGFSHVFIWFNQAGNRTAPPSWG